MDLESNDNNNDINTMTTEAVINEDKKEEVKAYTLPPYTDKHIDRMNYHHYTLQYKTGSNFVAPVRGLLAGGNAKVLDIGCGPGTWIMEMATEFEQARFVGFDVHPLFPNDCMPQNVEFYKANVLNGIPFQDNEFDYVHLRFIIIGIPEPKWEETVIKEILRVTKPNGWVEIIEGELEVDYGKKFGLFRDAFFRFLAKRDVNPRICEKIEDMLFATNQLKGITHGTWEMPIGEWGGKLGRYNAEHVFDFMSGFGSILAPELNMDLDEYGQLTDGIREEMENVKASHMYHYWYAQKKEETDSFCPGRVNGV